MDLFEKIIGCLATEARDADLETLMAIERALGELQQAVWDRRKIVYQTEVSVFGIDPLEINDMDCD